MWQGSTAMSSSLDLSCHESLANFDDEDFSVKNLSQISAASIEIDLNQSKAISSKFSQENEKNRDSINLTTNPVIHGNHASCQRRLDYESFENCISILDDDDYMKLLQSDNILDKPITHQSVKNFEDNTFTFGLLNEFTKNSKSTIVEREQNVKRANVSSVTAWVHSCDSKESNDWSQTPSIYNEYEQKVPEITLALNAENDMEDDNLDILIIKDEAMCDSDSGSEFDWNSLTPPVPASPNDQRVPETESGLDLCESDNGNYLVPSSSVESFLSSPFASAGYPGQHWFFQPQIALQNVADVSHSDSDQVVPDL